MNQQNQAPAQTHFHPRDIARDMSDSPTPPLAAPAGPFAALASPGYGDLLVRTRSEPPRTKHCVALLWNKYVPRRFQPRIAPNNTLTLLELPSAKDEFSHDFSDLRKTRTTISLFRPLGNT